MDQHTKIYRAGCCDKGKDVDGTHLKYNSVCSDTKSDVLCYTIISEDRGFDKVKRYGASSLNMGSSRILRMKRLGHSTDNMLKTVYQHTIKEKEIEYDHNLENYLVNLLEPGE